MCGAGCPLARLLLLWPGLHSPSARRDVLSAIYISTALVLRLNLSLCQPQVAVLTALLCLLQVSAGDRFALCLSFGRRARPSVWGKTAALSARSIVSLKGFLGLAPWENQPS